MKALLKYALIPAMFFACQGFEINAAENGGADDAGDGERYRPSNVRLTWSELDQQNAQVSSDGESVTFISKKGTPCVTSAKLPLNPKLDFSVDFVLSLPASSVFNVFFYSKGITMGAVEGNTMDSASQSSGFSKNKGSKSEQTIPQGIFGLSINDNGLLAIVDNGDSFPKKLDKASKPKDGIYVVGVEKKGTHLIFTLNGQNIYEGVAPKRLTSNVVLSFISMKKKPGSLLATHVYQDDYEEGSEDNASDED